MTRSCRANNFKNLKVWPPALLHHMVALVGVEIPAGTRVGSRLVASLIDPSGLTYKIVGESGSFVTRQISQSLHKIPAHYEDWDHVPEAAKLVVYRDLHHFFDPESWRKRRECNGIRMGISEDCARRFRDRKNLLKRHF